MTTANFPPASRLLSIQILRALAALMVTIAHTRYEFALKLGLGQTIPEMAGGAAGVDLFFVISGFVMVYGSVGAYGQPGAPQDFFIRRLIRIVPLYWIATTILVVHVAVNYTNLAAANQSVGTIIASYLFVPWPQPNGGMNPILGQGWTLDFEMFFYVLFAASLLVRPLIGVAGLALILILYVLAGPYLPLPLPLQHFANPLLFEFVFGMAIAAACHWRVRLPKAVPYCLLAIGAVGLAASVQWGSEGSLRVLIWGVPCALIVMGAVYSESTFQPGPIGRRLGRLLGLLGDASYALYLLHGFVHAAPRLLFPGLIDPSRFPWLYITFLVCLSVTFSCVFHIAVERPVTRWLRRLIIGKGARGRPSAQLSGAARS